MSGAPPFQATARGVGKRSAGRSTSRTSASSSCTSRRGSRRRRPRQGRIGRQVDTVGPSPPSGLSRPAGKHAHPDSWDNISGRGAASASLTGVKAFCDKLRAHRRPCWSTAAPRWSATKVTLDEAGIDINDAGGAEVDRRLGHRERSAARSENDAAVEQCQLGLREPELRPRRRRHDHCPTTRSTRSTSAAASPATRAPRWSHRRRRRPPRERHALRGRRRGDGRVRQRRPALRRRPARRPRRRPTSGRPTGSAAAPRGAARPRARFRSGARVRAGSWCSSA